MKLETQEVMFVRDEKQRRQAECAKNARIQAAMPTGKTGARRVVSGYEEADGRDATYGNQGELSMESGIDTSQEYFVPDFYGYDGFPSRRRLAGLYGDFGPEVDGGYYYSRDGGRGQEKSTKHARRQHRRRQISPAPEDTEGKAMHEHKMRSQGSETEGDMDRLTTNGSEAEGLVNRDNGTRGWGARWDALRGWGGVRLLPMIVRRVRDWSGRRSSGTASEEIAGSYFRRRLAVTSSVSSTTGDIEEVKEEEDGDVDAEETGEEVQAMSDEEEEEETAQEEEEETGQDDETEQEEEEETEQETEEKSEHEEETTQHEVETPSELSAYSWKHTDDYGEEETDSEEEEESSSHSTEFSENECKVVDPKATMSSEDIDETTRRKAFRKMVFLERSFSRGFSTCTDDVFGEELSEKREKIASETTGESKENSSDVGSVRGKHQRSETDNIESSKEGSWKSKSASSKEVLDTEETVNGRIKQQGEKEERSEEERWTSTKGVRSTGIRTKEISAHSNSEGESIQSGMKEMSAGSICGGNVYSEREEMSKESTSEGGSIYSRRGMNVDSTTEEGSIYSRMRGMSADSTGEGGSIYSRRGMNVDSTSAGSIYSRMRGMSVESTGEGGSIYSRMREMSADSTSEGGSIKSIIKGLSVESTSDEENISSNMKGMSAESKREGDSTQSTKKHQNRDSNGTRSSSSENDSRMTAETESYPGSIGGLRIGELGESGRNRIKKELEIGQTNPCVEESMCRSNVHHGNSSSTNLSSGRSEYDETPGPSNEESCLKNKDGDDDDTAPESPNPAQFSLINSSPQPHLEAPSAEESGRLDDASTVTAL
uniref:Uncharacterized protein n=2 Tax=Eptatretus burgeri TaxID=7764 RepID=A0A8C4QFB5_EPTBU